MISRPTPLGLVWVGMRKSARISLNCLTVPFSFFCMAHLVGVSYGFYSRLARSMNDATENDRTVVSSPSFPISIFFPIIQPSQEKKNPNNMQSLLWHLLPSFLPQHKTILCLCFGRLRHELSPTFPISYGQPFLLLISILSRYKMLHPQTSSSGHRR